MFSFIVRKSFTLVLLLALAGGYWLHFMFPRNTIPAHLTGHKLIDLQNFLTEQQVEDLLTFTRDLGVIPSAAREYDSYAVIRDHIGEAVPYNKTLGRCPGDYLMTDANLSRCIFPGRIDVGRHFITSGGSAEGLKQRYATLLGRVQPFQRIIFNYKDYETTTKLLENPRFQKLSMDICPEGKKVLDSFQTNLVVQVPGQTVAAHIDAPYFMRANRFSFPQWYLAVMVFSGLFKEDFIDQVQVVAYYHKWTDIENRKGYFYFWNTEGAAPNVSYPISGNANAVDGSKVVHAAAVYYPNRIPPSMPRTKVNELRYNKDTFKKHKKHAWDIVSDNETIATYDEDEIRFSVVYRGRCFRSEAEKRFYNSKENVQWTLEETNAVFHKDLVKRGVVKSIKAVQDLTAYDFGLLLLDTYVKYPYSNSASIPVNYCALDRKFPFASPIVDYLCH